MRDLIRLVSEAKTGTFYTTSKNKRTATGKLMLRKFDPKAINPKTGKPGAHVMFKEEKIK